MIVLHAAFENSLLVWAESTKQPKGPLIAGFDAGAATVASTLVELGVQAAKKHACEVVAWLPSTERGPIPSAAGLDDESSPAEAGCVAPWIVHALPLDAGRSIPLLAACSGKSLLRPGLLAGADLSYWAAALRFAAGLVMRGQFLPGVISSGAGIRARWQPVIAGPDVARMHALAQAMPPAARAVIAEAGDSPPEVPAQTALNRFLESAIDALVRSDGTRSSGAFDSIHDQWLHALTSNDGAMRADSAEAATLASQIQQWQRPIQVSAKAPFRLCFRLEEPNEDDGPWLVRYLLQGSRDPSLILPTSEAWNLKARGASALGKDTAAIREHLLSSLGQAAGIYPPIEASLRERAPEGCALDVTGAHGFLRETAAALEQSGFGVMLPGWWTRRGSQTRLKARAHVKSPALQGGAGMSLESMVKFDWKLALGEETISLAELTALARFKAPLVKLRGQWVEVDSAEIKAALEFLKKRSSGTATLGEIVRMSLGAAEAPTDLELDRVTATGWIADLLAQLEGSAPFEELPQPAELRGTLRPYQRRGYSWLQFLRRWGLGACLADDMGLGKTIQALALIQDSYRSNGQRPVLLVCPTSVVGNWQKEAARFAPDLPVLVHHGAGRHKGEAFEREAARYAIVLSSYALLHRDIEALRGISWGGVILDEAQNIKNPETKQARAARSLPAGWRVALTGTPVENNVGDLWSLMEFLNPGFLGSQGAFKKKFFLPIQVYGDQEAAARLHSVTGPFILRRLKTDKSIITDLPEKLEMKVFCNLTKEQASLYAAVVKDTEEALQSAEGISRKGLVLATLSKLKQVCNHPAQFLKDNSAIAGRSGKLARLTEMVEETLEVGDRSLIFTQFTEMGELIRRHLQESFGSEVLFLHGGVLKKARDRMVERFSGDGGPHIFLLSLKAGGTGLNLIRANHVFHFDRWWNPAVENQATDRAFRIGQTKNVQVHKFLCAGTLEEKIDEMIERKKDVAGRVVGTGEGWLTELSNAELKNLFALRKEAVGE
jgi:SNF2 family DNA or RNA helicase